MKHNTSLLSRKASLLKLRFSILLIIILLSAVCKCQESSKLNGTLISDKNDNNSDNQNASRKDYDAYTISDLWTTILERSSKSSNFESFNELFTECNMLSVRKRNLTEMTILMAYAMNRAIMKKLKAVENLVKVAEESFKNYTSNQDTRNSTFAKEYFNSKSLKLCANETENITVSTSVNKNGNTSSSATISLTLSNASVNAITARPNKSNKTRKEDIKGKKQEYFKGDNDKYCLTLHPNRHFMDLNVNLTYSTVHVPTIIYEQSDEILHSAAWSFHLNKAFLENYQNDPEITWQYFCGATGLYRTWPGTEWTYPDNMPKNKLVDLFDCRVRTWYVKATSSPRDVVILIDSSGSMTGIKRSIAVQTVETILDTLSDDDFVNILSFNNVIQYVDPCFQNGLVQATVENRKHLRDAIEDLPTNDIASLSEALIRAFKILNHARINIAKTEKVKCICQSHYIDSEMNISTDSACILSDNELRELENETSSNNSHNSFLDSSGCNKMIMLVTDGANENAVDVFRELNWKVNYTYSCHLKETRVFTYLIGRELGDERPVKWMACANRGVHARVSTPEDIQDNVQEYIPVISRPISLSDDHVTVWSSVFLDIEKNDPLKEYKWYPYIIKNRGMPMDLFKSKEKKYHLMISVAQPAFDTLQNESHAGGLLGAVAVDIPIRLLREFVPIHKLGVHGYSFLINHNGYVIYHPDLTPVLGEYRKRNYNSIDIDALELHASINKYTHNGNITNTTPIHDLRRQMIMGLSGRKDITVKRAYDDMRRVEIFENSYFFSTLGDKNSNPFSLGIALRLPYGEYEVFAKGVNINIIKKAIDFVSWPQLFFSNWVYCNSTIEYKYDNPREPVLFYLKEKLNDSSQNSCANDSNEQLINHLIVDLYVMSQFDENLIKHRSKQKPTKVDDDFIGDISFIATSSGVSAYWCQSVCSLEQNKTARHFFSQNPITIESVYYQRTVNFTYQKLKLANSSNPEDLDKLFLFSFHYVPYTDGENSTKILHKRFAIATTTIWLKENNELRVPIAVTGTIMEQNEVFHTEFINKLTDICDTEKKLFCYILDEHGYVFAQPESKNDTVGKFFGEVNALIMNDMIQRQIYDNVTVFDFQSVCLTNKTKSSNRSSSSLAHHRFETSYMLCFTIFRVFLSMLIMMIRKSIAEAGMSLTKFLPTHFDFQAPQMNMEDGPSQPSFLEACIEIEHLFTTAKSILDLNGEAITFQINCNETTNETNTTKTIAAARYTIQQLRGSNLFFLNFTYLIDSFENFTCNQSTIIITKTPVSLSEQDKCNRLKTTPYRERPQKCYFVNDNEPDGTCWSGSSRIIDRTKLSILLIQFCCLLYIFTAFAL